MVKEFYVIKTRCIFLKPLTNFNRDFSLRMSFSPPHFSSASPIQSLVTPSPTNVMPKRYWLLPSCLKCRSYTLCVAAFRKSLCSGMHWQWHELKHDFLTKMAKVRLYRESSSKLWPCGGSTFQIQQFCFLGAFFKAFLKLHRMVSYLASPAIIFSSDRILFVLVCGVFFFKRENVSWN